MLLAAVEATVQEPIAYGSEPEKTLLLMGDLYLALGRTEDAKHAFDRCLKALQDDDRFDAVADNLATHLSDNGYRDEIDAVLLRQIARAEHLPDDKKTALLSTIVSTYFCTYRFEEAIIVAAQIPKESKRSHRMHLPLQYLANAGQVEKANAFVVAHDLGIEGQLRIARGLAEADKHVEALDIARKAVDEINDTVTGFDRIQLGFHVARVCAVCGKTDIAMHILQVIDYGSTSYFDVHRELSHYFTRRKQFTEAKHHAEKMLEFTMDITRKLTEVTVLYELTDIAVAQEKSGQREAALAFLYDIWERFRANASEAEEVEKGGIAKINGIPISPELQSSFDDRMIQIRSTRKKVVHHFYPKLLAKFAEAGYSDEAIPIFEDWYHGFSSEISSEDEMVVAVRTLVAMAEAGLAYGIDPLIASMEA